MQLKCQEGDIRKQKERDLNCTVEAFILLDDEMHVHTM